MNGLFLSSAFVLLGLFSTHLFRNVVPLGPKLIEEDLAVLTKMQQDFKFFSYWKTEYCSYERQLLVPAMQNEVLFVSLDMYRNMCCKHPASRS